MAPDAVAPVPFCDMRNSKRCAVGSSNGRGTYGSQERDDCLVFRPGETISMQCAPVGLLQSSGLQQRLE
jgi:hypothetical protein